MVVSKSPPAGHYSSNSVPHVVSCEYKHGFPSKMAFMCIIRFFLQDNVLFKTYAHTHNVSPDAPILGGSRF